MDEHFSDSEEKASTAWPVATNHNLTSHPIQCSIPDFLYSNYNAQHHCFKFSKDKTIFLFGIVRAQVQHSLAIEGVRKRHLRQEEVH